MLPTLAAFTALLASTSPSVPPSAAETDSLPAGDSAALRATMLDWSAPDDSRVPMTHSGDMERPVAAGRLSSRFGTRVDPVGNGWRVHRGVDIAAPLGTPVIASADGMVSFAGTAGGYGSLVQIDHTAGVQTRYGHLSRIFARSGEFVRRGDAIGTMGSSGRSTGSHLHYEIRIAGLAVDPQQPLPVQPTTSSATPSDLVVEPHWQGMTVSADHLPAAYR